MSKPHQETLPAALRHFDELPDAAYVRQRVVEQLFSIKHATVWRHVREGLLPQPKKLSARVTAWNVGDLRKALDK